MRSGGQARLMRSWADGAHGLVVGHAEHPDKEVDGVSRRGCASRDGSGTVGVLLPPEAVFDDDAGMFGDAVVPAAGFAQMQAPGGFPRMSRLSLRVHASAPF